MKTVADLITAVNAKLTENFPDIDIRSTDLDKHPEKCFYTEYTANRDGTPDFVHDSGRITLFYFPEDGKVNRVELVDMQAKLSQVFTYRLELDDDFAVPVVNLNFTPEDDALVMEFDFDMHQRIDNDKDIVTMKNIELQE